MPLLFTSFLEPLSFTFLLRFHFHLKIGWDDVVVISGCGPLGLGMVAGAKKKVEIFSASYLIDLHFVCEWITESHLANTSKLDSKTTTNFTDTPILMVMLLAKTTTKSVSLVDQC